MGAGLCCLCVHDSSSSVAPAARLDGKVCFVTGVTRGGIGYESARAFAARGARLILAGRRMTDLEESKAAIIRSVEGGACGCCRTVADSKLQIDCLQLDLADLAKVRACVEAFKQLGVPRIHVMLNNSGILSPGYKLTPQGVESQMGVNHLGHWYLNALLLPFIRAPPGEEPGRVVCVSSVAHQQGSMNSATVPAAFKPTKERYDEWASYGDSKLANVLHSKAIASRYGPERGVVSYSLHPGVISSSLGVGECYIRCFCIFCAPCLKSVKQGAATQVYVSVAPLPELTNGGYYDDATLSRSNGPSSNPALIAALWIESSRLCKEFEASVGVGDVLALEAKEAAEGLAPVVLPPVNAAAPSQGPPPYGSKPAPASAPAPAQQSMDGAASSASASVAPASAPIIVAPKGEEVALASLHPEPAAADDAHKDETSRLLSSSEDAHEDAHKATLELAEVAPAPAQQEQAAAEQEVKEQASERE